MELVDSGVPGVSVATILDRLDAASAMSVEPWLLGLLAANRLVLDMAAVRFVSSAGLRVLLKLAKAAKASGSKFAICSLQPKVREVVEISGFDRIIPTYATRQAAAAALG